MGGAPPTPPDDSTAPLNNVGTANWNSLKLIGDGIGLLANFAGAIGGAISFVDFLLESLGGPKADAILASLENLQTTIDSDFHQLGADLAAENILSRLDDIQMDLSSSEALYGDLLSGKLLSLQLTPNDINTYILACITAMYDLTYDPSFPTTKWNVVGDQQPFWSDAGVYIFWGGPNPAVSGSFAGDIDAGYGPFRIGSPGVYPPNATVFDYTYILPKYLQALLIFMGVAGSLDPNFAGPNDYGYAITGGPLLPVGAATMLKTVHDTILHGIQKMQPGAVPYTQSPSGYIEWDGFILNEWLSGENTGAAWAGLTPIPPDIWKNLDSWPDSVNIEYGAVDIFSGVSRMADYVIKFSTAFPNDYSDMGPYYKFQIRLLRKAKEVYVAVGLTDLWNLINSLNRLVGGPLMSRPNFADWSFRNELIPMSNIAAQKDGNYHLMDLVRFLKHTAPDDTPSLDKASTTSLQVALSPITTSRL
jgi:hypothetical protein